MDAFISALELADSLRDKRVSPVEVVDFYLDRVERINPDLNAVTWRRDEQLRAEAKAAESKIMRGEVGGRFFGVPIAIKDLIHVEGWPITFGSRAFADHIAAFTATTVQRMVDAGFLLAYRTNTPELGIVSVTENQLHGATRNPWDTARSPGGSSGGSGAVVAAGLAPIAHASDGGGSIRIPASCCGLVGLKPSRGRVSEGPMVSDVMHGGVTEGCVSHTVADTAAMLDIIGQPDPTAWYNAPAPQRPFLDEVGADVGRLRVAFTTAAPTGAPVAPACVEAVEKTAKLLAELGHEVFEDAPAWPDQNDIFPMFLTVWNTSPALFGVSDWDNVEPLTRVMRDHAMAVDSLTYVHALGMLQVHSRRIVSSWGRDFDVLLTPTIAIEPPPIGAIFEGADKDPMIALLNAGAMAAFTPLINVTGQPAISLPLHWSQSGLPIGVQLVGRPWGEAELLRLAAQLEQAQPWSDRHPAVS